MEFSFEIIVLVICLIIGVRGIMVMKLVNREEEKEIEESSQIRIKIDNEKKLAQQVKFIMRLKRKMKSFKQRKIKKEMENCQSINDEKN